MCISCTLVRNINDDGDGGGGGGVGVGGGGGVGVGGGGGVVVGVVVLLLLVLVVFTMLIPADKKCSKAGLADFFNTISLGELTFRVNHAKRIG